MLLFRELGSTMANEKAQKMVLMANLAMDWDMRTEIR